MEKLSTIQKRENLNDVYAGGKGAGGAAHFYVIIKTGTVHPITDETDVIQVAPDDFLLELHFQEGARKDPNSKHGVLDEDLLEIVRDRLKSFQEGEFATRENACALTHIEEALMWLNKRVEDRIERKVLGTYNK